MLVTKTSQDTDRSIAILPLLNLNLDSDNECLCDGIAAELIHGLSKVDDLVVASQIASFRYKDQNTDLKTMGEQLGVNTILSGSVQRSGNRVRVSVNLDQITDGRTLWTDRYEGTLDDIFEFQDSVAKQVVAALKLQLKVKGADRDTLIEAGTSSGSAYDALLLADHEFCKQTNGVVIWPWSTISTPSR